MGAGNVEWTGDKVSERLRCCICGGDTADAAATAPGFDLDLGVIRQARSATR